MGCNLKKDKTEKAAYYRGNDGTLYPMDEYNNWGVMSALDGKKDLPLGGYPYTIVYIERQKFLCCEFCKCE